jgi:hypothetical protein
MRYCRIRGVRGGAFHYDSSDRGSTVRRDRSQNYGYLEKVRGFGCSRLGTNVGQIRVVVQFRQYL